MNTQKQNPERVRPKTAYIGERLAKKKCRA